jgi:hypothetical protein
LKYVQHNIIVGTHPHLPSAAVADSRLIGSDPSNRT